MSRGQAPRMGDPQVSVATEPCAWQPMSCMPSVPRPVRMMAKWQHWNMAGNCAWAALKDGMQCRCSAVLMCA